MIQCIIFDCDGTLVDSEFLGNQVLAKHFVDHGVDITAEQLVAEFRGGHFTEMLQTIELRHNAKIPSDFIENYRLLAQKAFEQDLVSIQGAEHMLQQLELPICIASNAPVVKTKSSLAITGLTSYFGDRIYSAYDVEAWKPKPDLFLHAAQQMGFEAQQCLVVEDSDAGVQAGLAAQMQTVVLDPDNEHTAVDGLHRISALAELPATLANIIAGHS